MVNNTLALQNKESVDLQTLRDALPAKLKNSVSQEMLDRVIQSTEPELCNQLKENFIGYTSVLLDGKFKAEDYLYDHYGSVTTVYNKDDYYTYCFCF